MPKLSPKYVAPLFAVLLAACSTQPAPDDSGIHFERMHAVIKGKPFTLEVADDAVKRERGLMYRESMPSDHGMIFVFVRPDNYRFWMRNTYIPLDIVFLDSQGKVLDVEARKPLDDTSMGPDEPSSYVIELNQGTCDKIGLHKGDQVLIPENMLKPASRSDEK